MKFILAQEIKTKDKFIWKGDTYTATSNAELSDGYGLYKIYTSSIRLFLFKDEGVMLISSTKK